MNKCELCGADSCGKYFIKGDKRKHEVCVKCYHGTTRKNFQTLKVKYDRSPASFMVIRDSNIERMNIGKPLASL